MHRTPRLQRTTVTAHARQPCHCISTHTCPWNTTMHTWHATDTCLWHTPMPTGHTTPSCQWHAHLAHTAHLTTQTCHTTDNEISTQRTRGIQCLPVTGTQRTFDRQCTRDATHTWHATYTRHATRTEHGLSIPVACDAPMTVVQNIIAAAAAAASTVMVSTSPKCAGLKRTCRQINAGCGKG